MSENNTVFLLVSKVFWEISDGAMVGLDKYFIEIMLPQELALAGKVQALVTMLQVRIPQMLLILSCSRIEKTKNKLIPTSTTFLQMKPSIHGKTKL